VSQRFWPLQTFYSQTSTHWTIHSFSPAYDDAEPEYDPDEPAEPFDPDVETNGQVDDIAVGQNPDQLLTTGDRGVVVSGDPAAAANRGKGGEKAPKDKKIPHDQRTTTPYMTKYERARILGTRALQIRLVFTG
jgi:DNA-directed RNA polymerases I, II, and III subunit RPABC2